jgi:hypothetical protein
MKKQIILISILALLSANISWASLGGSPTGAEENVLKIKAAENTTALLSESDYHNVTDGILIEFNEDLNYSSSVLDDYVKGNISRDDAIYSTISVYVMNIHTINTVLQVKPSEKFSNYHNYLTLMVTDFQLYLWNLAKFYETNNSNYALQARENYNTSTDNYDKALQERVLNFV